MTWSSVPLGPDPAITEYNEVINYIPDTGINITVGTTTVGVSFSLPQPEWLEYVGYRIYSPSGVVVFNASTTPSAPGIYEIDTDFNFDTAGVYTGHAYFAQDFGGSVWEVDNTSIQQIAVDVTQWTVTPGGGFSQNNATNSTTTLSNFTLDCGDGFINSVCNFFERLVIPEATSIQNFFSSLALFVQKPPLSFFYELYSAFGAFGASYTPGYSSLSLTLFGNTFPVVSTTTASVVGLSGSTLENVRVLMTGGIFVLGLWAVFWRARHYAEILLGVKST
jgi:hypothetical protein